MRSGLRARSVGRAPGIALCAVLAVGWAGAARAQDVISLRSTATVDGAGKVTLKDIAELSGAQAERLADVVIETASDRAADGEWKEIAISDIRAALEGREDIHWGRLVLRGGTCSVRRGGALARSTPAAKTTQPAPTPGGPTVRSLVARRIAETLNVSDDSLRLTFDENDRELLDTPTPGRTADIQMVGSSERQPVSVRLFEGLNIVANGSVRVSVNVRRTVAVSTVPLRRGDAVKPENVVIEPRWLGPGKRPAAVESVVGTVIRGRVDAGEMIEEMDVEPPVVVKKGDLIDVYCLCGSISLKSVARAMETGRDGEMVKFQSPDSKRTFQARMDGPGRAVTGLVGSAGSGVGAGTDVDAGSSPGADGRTEAPIGPTDPKADGNTTQVGGVRVTRSARSEDARRADATHLRMADLGDQPVKKKERKQ